MLKPFFHLFTDADAQVGLAGAVPVCLFTLEASVCIDRLANFSASSPTLSFWNLPWTFLLWLLYDLNEVVFLGIV